MDPLLHASVPIVIVSLHVMCVGSKQTTRHLRTPTQSSLFVDPTTFSPCTKNIACWVQADFSHLCCMKYFHFPFSLFFSFPLLFNFIDLCSSSLLMPMILNAQRSSTIDPHVWPHTHVQRCCWFSVYPVFCSCTLFSFFQVLLSAFRTLAFWIFSLF